jgi:hypothetical protein
MCELVFMTKAEKSSGVDIRCSSSSAT